MQTIIKLEGKVLIARPGQSGLPVTMGDRAADPGKNWLATGAITSLSQVTFLLLQHTAGEEATWILDRDGAYIGNAVSALEERTAATLVEDARLWLDRLVSGFFTDPSFGTGSDGAEFFELAPTLRADLLRHAGTPAFPTPAVIDVAAFEPVTVPTTSGNILLDPEYVRACVQADPEQHYLVGCRTGRMCWPSPVDGHDVDEVRGFALSHLMIAWRCVDRRNDLVFFVFATGFGSAVPTLFVPAAGLLVHRSSDPSLARDEHYLPAMIGHLLGLGRELLPFLGRPVSRMAQYMWGEGALHVGHYHWNELPGLETIVASLDRMHYPLIYDIAGGAGENFYERLALLYPEFTGRIELGCPTMEAMSRNAYLRGLQPIRFSGAYVSAQTRNRISNVISLTKVAPETERVRAERAGPVVVLGLRVENRTLVDPLDLYVALAKSIARTYGGGTIVIDGHNSKSSSGDQAFSSYLEQRASIRPIDVERQFVADFRDRLRKYPLRIVDCVGMSLSDNLAWMQIADLCVAPWGAGLAKYRWALNLPCYVLAGEYCKKHKGDIDIYTGEQDMEKPTRLVFISESLVTDRPDLPTLVKMDPIYEPYYVNYEVDVQATLAEIMAFVADNTSATPIG